jgi:hypothetical protein
MRALRAPAANNILPSAQYPVGFDFIARAGTCDQVSLSGFVVRGRIAATQRVQ